MALAFVAPRPRQELNEELVFVWASVAPSGHWARGTQGGGEREQRRVTGTPPGTATEESVWNPAGASAGVGLRRPRRGGWLPATQGAFRQLNLNHFPDLEGIELFFRSAGLMPGPPLSPGAVRVPGSPPGLRVPVVDLPAAGSRDPGRTTC